MIFISVFPQQAESQRSRLSYFRPVKADHIKRGQASLCHTKPYADRCFLPDLAGLSNVLLHRT